MIAPGLLVTGLLGGFLLSTGPAGLAGATPRPHVQAGPRVGDAYNFDMPDAVALSGNDLFVTNYGNNSVTEMDASTGAFVASISGAQYGFHKPSAIVAVGKNLWITNTSGDSVTEITAAGGAFVRKVSGGVKFPHPIAIATNGSSYVFVLSQGDVVTRLSTATGDPSGRASGSTFSFNEPTAIAAVNSDLFVTNSGGDSVTEIDLSTMKLVSVLSGGTYDFMMPTGIAKHNNDLWITNELGSTVTELAASTDGTVQVVPNTSGYLPTPGPITYGDGYVFAASPPGGSPMITQIVPTNPASLPWMMCNTNGPYTFSNPQALVVFGSDLWVVNEGGAGGPTGNSLTEMDADSGALIQVVS